ncbi:MAG: glutamate--tRNA ligase [Proteobacteria bacterium]|nr:glutamate--tRNA ligase [Pseudomonadota bacterium]
MTGKDNIRVRFAPSPTGGLHPGNARIAVFNWLFAQHEKTKGNNAKYILRMEDTDEERSTAEHESSILEDLKWLGITWDEGPFRQSDRTKRYREVADVLFNKGFLYRCYCTEEECAQERAAQIKASKPPRYSGKCKKLTNEQKIDNDKNKTPYTLRFDVEKFINDINDGNDQLSYHDLIKNREATSMMSNPLKVIGDFVVIKQSGTPTYNFAVVVDDIDMKITHVFRGEDHVSNTFRQLMIFIALDVKGGDLPKYGHLPMLLAPDKTKLSKRSGGVPIHEYKEMGFLAEAMFNHLALLGGGIKGVEETDNKNTLAKAFDYKDTASSACVYDIEKLKHINTKIIQKLNEEDVFRLLTSDLNLNDNWKKYYSRELFAKIISLAKNGARLLTDVIGTIKIFTAGRSDDLPLNERASLDFKPEQKAIVDYLHKEFVVSKKQLSGPTWKETKEKIISLGVLSGGKLFKTLRLILTERTDGPPLDEIMLLINNDVVVERIKKARQIEG